MLLKKYLMLTIAAFHFYLISYLQYLEISYLQYLEISYLQYLEIWMNGIGIGFHK